MPDAAADAEYQQYLAWKSQTTTATVPANETPAVHINHVLKTLVNSARLASEGTVRQFCTAIDEAFPVEEKTTESATNA